MAKVYFAPFHAIKYVGTKAKVFNTSLARPKPTLKKGDIVIVDKVTAFNLVKKGFGEFVDVTEIEFTKSDKANAENIRLKAELVDIGIDEAFGVIPEVHNTRELADEPLATTTPAVSE